MLHVDIATKIVSQDTQIWVVFPGRSRRFLNTFLRRKVIFLETPGIKLRPSIANDKLKLRQHTRMSLAMAEYLRGATKRVPSRNPRTYSDDVFKDRADQVLASNVRKMFGKMKVGDLVVVPGKVFEPVYFGEVGADFSADDTIFVERYGDEPIPCRKVRWLNAGVQRIEIPPYLQGYLSKPPAIARVQRSIDTEEFFRLAYPSVVLAEKSAVIMDGPLYDGKNPLATHEANFLVSYFISAFSAIEEEKLEEFSKLDVKSAIEKFYDPELVQSFTQNFNSPGKFGLQALSAALAIFVSAGIAISLLNFTVSELAGGIEVTNSVSAEDAQIASDAGVKLDYLFNALHKEQIEEINSLAKKAQENVGLETPVQVEKIEPGAEP
jgi:hypothetical protein